MSATDFQDMVTNYCRPFLALRQMMFDAGQYRYVTETDEPTKKDALLAGARAEAALNTRAISVFEDLLDAFESQLRLGAAYQDLSQMRDAIDGFNQNAFVTAEAFGDDATTINTSRILSSPEELIIARGRMKELFDSSREEEERQRLDQAKRDYESAAARVPLVRYRIAVLERDQTLNELGSLGLFEWSRKRELKDLLVKQEDRLAAASSQLSADERDEADEQWPSLQEARAELERLQTKLDDLKNQIASM